MFDFNTIVEFSCTHCIAICAFLVPANLLATIVTLSLTALGRPQTQVWQVAGIGNIFASIMVMHVLSWLMIGVVMAPTYILFIMASTCLSMNLWAQGHQPSLRGLIRTLLFYYRNLTYGFRQQALK